MAIMIIIKMIHIIKKQTLSLFAIQDWPYKEVIQSLYEQLGHPLNAALIVEVSDYSVWSIINEEHMFNTENAKDSKENVWVSRHRKKTTGNKYIQPQKDKMMGVSISLALNFLFFKVGLKIPVVRFMNQKLL